MSTDYELLEGTISMIRTLGRRARCRAPCGHCTMISISPAVLLASALLLADVATAFDCPPGPRTGTVTHVRDGDTIEIGDLAIRLAGITAPEIDEPGGTAATDFMRRIALGRVVECDLVGDRSHDRCIAICFDRAGVSLGWAIVAAGRARDCPRFSGEAYARAEEVAAQNGATIRETYELPGYCR